MKRPNVLNLTCPAIPVVRIGFVGLGNRGILALERYMHPVSYTHLDVYKRQVSCCPV